MSDLAVRNIIGIRVSAWRIFAASEKQSVYGIAGENTIDSLGGKKVNGHYAQLYADFDHPTRSDCNMMGSSKPLPLEYTVAGGDSGGGLFPKNKGKWELIGICSGSEINIDKLMKVGYYGQSMNWVRVSVFEKWIRDPM
ncbi:hypothetical protein [Flavobacterium sp.]|uniref:hypothetical protein n=1 Tax=Flavobacterium sp. TaxID=239 RepID=UPI00403331E4